MYLFLQDSHICHLLSNKVCSMQTAARYFTVTGMLAQNLWGHMVLMFMKDWKLRTYPVTDLFSL